jgi:hypothetical protein
LNKFLSVSLIAIAAAAPVAARAQDSAPAAKTLAAAAEAPANTPAAVGQDDAGDGTFSENEIIVTAGRLPGEVMAPQPPILELNEKDIASYGAGSLSELIDSLSTVTGSGRGRGSGPPVFLVNGVRVSSFREMRSYPPEALRKVEVLSEEVAQQFGYSPDQRVINFILKDNFQSREIEAEYKQPDKGGYSQKELEATYLLINGVNRFNLNAEVNDSSMLTEAERGVIQAQGSVPGLATDPDPAAYRSLVSDSASYEVNGNWTTKLADNGTSLSLNGAFERQDSRSLQGLDSVLLTDPAGATMLRTLDPDNPIEVRNRTDTYSLGSTFNAPLGDWQLTGTIDANLGRSRNLIDRYGDTSALVDAAAAGDLALDADLGLLPDAGYDEARSNTYTIDSLVTAIGHPLELPAGEVSVTLDAGAKWNGIDSRDTRNPGVKTSLDRRRLTAGVNVGIPLTDRDSGGLGAIGDINLNLNAGVDHLSDFGTLTDWTVGLNWGLTDKLNFNASYIAKDEAPSLTQLGAAEIATPNVPVYDLSRGETVLATVISGGNPALPAQTQRDWKFGASWELPLFQRSRITVDYFKNHSENVASGFPLLTPQIEAAFPGRVTRDISGRLVSIDQRPVTFAETNSQRLQIGLNLSGSVGKPQPEADATDDSAGFRRGGFAGPGGPGQGAGQGPGQGERRFDPERFAKMREQFCGDANAERLPTAEEVAALPEQLRARLSKEDGSIDPDRWKTFRERICAAPAPGSQAQGGQGRPGGGDAAGGPRGGGDGAGRRGGGGFRGGPGMMGGGGGNGQGRWFLGLNHTIELSSTVLVAPGGPELDLLDGDALASAQPRHKTNARLGMFYRGFGGNVAASYTGSSRVDGSGLPGSTDLFFDDIATFDVRLFVDFNQQASVLKAVPFLKNARLSLSVDNVFDARQRVTDSNGDVPLRYQPYLIDPVGRSIGIELRKMF